jgi:hypothetical protein
MSEDNQTDLIEGVLIALAVLSVGALILVEGYVPIDAFADIRDGMPKFSNLGIYGQSAYTIIAVVSVGSAGAHRFAKRRR